MKGNWFLWMVALGAFGLAPAVWAAPVSPTGVTLVQGTEAPGYPAANLIDGAAASRGAVWATLNPNGVNDYFLAGSAGPAPVLEFDLGAERTVDTLLLWPGAIAGDSAKTVSLRFATAAEGAGGYGSITFSPTLAVGAPGGPTPEMLLLQREVTCRYVELTITDNHFTAPPSFLDDFEGYAAGSQIHGQGGWEGWTGDPAAGALVSSDYAYSGTRSVNITGGSDLVHPWTGYTSGKWILSVMQYIPSASTGDSYFILMNSYPANLNWSVQTVLHLGTGIVESWSGQTTPMVKDAWVELRCEIDLDANTLSEYYNGVLLASRGWQSDGINEIQAVDLYANGAGPVYYDDIWIGTSVPGGNRVGLGEVAVDTAPAAPTAPTIVRDPLPQHVAPGETAVFTVVPDGSQPLGIQWRFNGAELAGETNQALVIASAGFADAGVYDAVVVNAQGTATSQPARLSGTIDTIAPARQSVMAGVPAQFSIAENYDSYQWVKNGTDVAGKTGPVLAFPAVAAGDAGTYTVRLTLGGATNTAEPVELSVLPAPSSAYARTVMQDIPVAYWRLGETAGTTAVDLVGEHDGEYVNAPALGQPGALKDDADPAVGFDGFDDYVDGKSSLLNGVSAFTLSGWIRLNGTPGARCGLFGQNDAVEFGFSDANTLQLWTPSGGQIDYVHGLAVGEWYHLAVVGAPTGTVLYVNGARVGNTAGTIVDFGSSADAFLIGGPTFDAIGADQGTYFPGDIDEVAVYTRALPAERVWTQYATGIYGNDSPPVITAPPADQAVILGDTNAVASFSVAVTGTLPMSFEWRKDGVAIPGATNNPLVIANAGPADVGQYTVVVSNYVGTDNTLGEPASLTVVCAPVVPVAQARIAGDTAAFSVSMPADSTGYLYQWHKDGVDIPGATTDTLVLTGLSAGDSGEYTVTVTLGAEVVTSNPAPLTVAGLSSTPYAGLVATAAPVVWWRLGEPEGATVAADAMGYLDADIWADTAVGATGALMGDADTSANFPGTANAKVELYDAYELAFPQFTVEFWALMSGGANFRSPITNRDIFNNEISGWTFYLTAENAWQFRVGDGGTAWAGSLTGPTATLGAWAHVVGSYDGATMRLYVDGALVGEQAAGYLPQDYNPLWVGAGATESENGNFFWVGRIDEVALYDRAIASEEVLAHWAAAFQADAPPEITGHPQPVSVLAGGDAAFSVAARGAPLLTYQWQKDGVALPGETNTTLALASVDMADAGLYRAVVTNPAGTATSDAAELKVIDPNMPYQDLVLDDGPVAYWRLGELSGTIAVDSAGGNDAAYTDVTLGEPGALPADPDTSVRFNGTSSWAGSGVSLVNDLGAFTMEGWFKLATVARMGFWGQNDAIEFGLSNNTTMQIWASGAGAVDVTYTWGADSWHHVVAVGDGTGLRVYVDGVLAGSGGSGTANYGSSTYPFNIGGGGIWDATGNWFNGWIDEVAFYDYALSPEQVAIHYTVGTTAFDLVPVAIGLEDGTVTVRWDGDGVLQQTDDLPGDAWTDVPGTPASPYTDPAPANARSFRLREP